MKSVVYASVLAAAMAVPVAAQRPAQAEEPSDQYNGPIQSSYKCISPRNPNAPIEMYAVDGTDTKVRFNGISWGGSNPPCPSGKLRISSFPPVEIGDTTMYMQRGGDGTTTQDSVIRHGFVRVGDLRRRPVQVQPAAPNGRPCAKATDTLYYNNPQPIPDGLQYKPGGTSSDWANYGDPIHTKGTFHPPGVHYSYLLWNWMWSDNTGGGQVRAVVMKNDRIRLCDVARIVSPAYAPGSDQVVGFVQGAYGRVTSSAGESVTGWFVEAWSAVGYGGLHYQVSTTPVP